MSELEPYEAVALRLSSKARRAEQRCIDYEILLEKVEELLKAGHPVERVLGFISYMRGKWGL